MREAHNFWISLWGKKKCIFLHVEDTHNKFIDYLSCNDANL
jgi:hypothetical protein